VSGSVARVGEALRVGSRPAWLVVLVGLVGIAGVTALATRQGMLPMLIALVAMNYHFVGDVIAGSTLGAIVGTFAVALSGLTRT